MLRRSIKTTLLLLWITLIVLLVRRDFFIPELETNEAFLREAGPPGELLRSLVWK